MLFNDEMWGTEKENYISWDFDVGLKSKESFLVLVTWRSDVYFHQSALRKNPNKFLMAYYQISLKSATSNSMQVNKDDYYLKKLIKEQSKIDMDKSK